MTRPKSPWPVVYVDNSRPWLGTLYHRQRWLRAVLLSDFLRRTVGDATEGM